MRPVHSLPIFLSLFCLLFPVFSSSVFSQVTLAFQGGEPGDAWTFTSTLASALAEGEAMQAPNKVTGTRSLVVGGNTGGGNCFAGGSGNGPMTARTFTFSPVDISTSNESVRTLRFNWGNRFPGCNGTGWDAAENLVFTPYHDGVAQSSTQLATGNNNAQFSIQANQHVHQIPACVNSFYFVVSVSTNRADELLFIDNVSLTAPQLNGSSGQPSPITGPVTVCAGTTSNYSVTAVGSTVYTWSGLPAGAQFTTPNGVNAIAVDWGTAAPGTYTLTVTPSGTCSATAGPVQTLSITVDTPPVPVTISGPASFCPGESITLSSSYASGNNWSTSETTPSITVTAAGTYTVTVSGSCGTVSDQHTVVMENGPAIQNVAVTDVSCYGQNDGSITIHANGTDPEYSLDGVSWQSAATFTGMAPGNYTLFVRETGGLCTSTASAVVDEPQELIAGASDSGPYCSGTPIVLNGASNVAGAAYTWSGPNGYTSAVQHPTDATEAGVYTLIISLNGCNSASAQTTVIVTPQPTAVASNTGPYCAGQAIVLNGASDAATAAYSWSGPSGYTSNLQHPTDAISAGEYTLVVTASGCTSQPAVTSVSVNALPVATASYTAPYCSGNPLLLFGNATPAGNATYNWNGPAGFVSGEQHPTNAPGAGAYTLTVTQNGCTSAPVTVNVVEQLPVVNVSNTGPYCPGETVILQSIVYGATAPVYTWSGPDGYTATVPNPVNATQSGIYTLTVSENNCTVSASTVVTVHEASTAAFTATTACEGQITDFNCISTPGSQQAIVSWSWDFGDGTTSGAAMTTGHIYSSAGTYAATLQIATDQGCTTSVTNTVIVAEAPQADFQTSPGTISDLDPVIQFINTSQGADSYEWVFPNGDVLTEIAPEYTFPEGGGNYQVLLVARNAAGCSDSISRILVSENVVLYYVPNAFTPDGDEYNNTFQPVFTEGFDPENFGLRIYDRWGGLIFESHDPATGWDGSYAGSAAASGVYTWQIRFKHRDTDEWEEPVGHLTLIR